MPFYAQPGGVQGFTLTSALYDTVFYKLYILSKDMTNLFLLAFQQILQHPLHNHPRKQHVCVLANNHVHSYSATYLTKPLHASCLILILFNWDDI
jgi:hypothetical protein